MVHSSVPIRPPSLVFVLALVLAGSTLSPFSLAAQSALPMDADREWTAGSSSLAAQFDFETAIDPAALGRERLNADLTVLREMRPTYPFWQHIFTIPDGSVAYGSAQDGRLLAVFPASGDWGRVGRWEESWLADLIVGLRIDGPLQRRRERVSEILEPAVGRVVHNATRGNFFLPNARRYGPFVSDWSAIYERFGVPGELGLAQAILESGLDGRIRSEARALGFCQWLPQNWERMKRLAHNTIEGYNQTTQAPYCAAYLTILATKYGSFIPALSEHHAGGTNVGRIVIAGQRIGGHDAREQYLLGSQLARDLRDFSAVPYRDVYASYGPRSFRYAEMVFGNTFNVRRLELTVTQERIHAMRTRRPIPLSEITRRTGLSVNEVRRYNPALVNAVPARATLYLPTHIQAFGDDVAFWHKPADPGYAAILDEFLRLDRSVDGWHDPAFRRVLSDFRRRFADTGTEEGRIMATVLAFVDGEIFSVRRNQILAEYRGSSRIIGLIERGIREREERREPEVAQH